MNLPLELLREIIYFLPNEDVFNINIVNKQINNLSNDKTFVDNITYRWHPMVFNNLDNLCGKCNLRIAFLCDPFHTIKCKHFGLFHTNNIIYEPRVDNL